MGARQRAWARRVRDGMLDLLGRQCAWCGSSGPLSFDCIVPTGPAEGHKSAHHRLYDWSWRMSFYRAQLLAGNLQVLCLSCNSAKGVAVSPVARRVYELLGYDLPSPPVRLAGAAEPNGIQLPAGQ